MIFFLKTVEQKSLNKSKVNFKNFNINENHFYIFKMKITPERILVEHQNSDSSHLYEYFITNFITFAK